MAVEIRWHPPVVPEERKKAQWESIIRFALGERLEPVEVGLRFSQDRLRWQLETPGMAEGFRATVVDALRSTGKPVE